MFDLLVRHIVVEPNADPMAGIHVVRCIYRIVTGFQFVDYVGVALDGTSLESVDVEETENPACHIERQYGLRRTKCLKRHLLAAVGHGEAKFSEFLYIHCGRFYNRTVRRFLWPE